MTKPSIIMASIMQYAGFHRISCTVTMFNQMCWWQFEIKHSVPNFSTAISYIVIGHTDG